MNIVIADDDRNLRFLLKSMLLDCIGEDSMIEEARDGNSLVAVCAQTHPDLAFVDIKMPNLNGMEAIAQAKTLTPNTLFVVLTGYGEFAYAQRCISLGVLDYLLKPVEPSALAHTLAKAKEQLEKTYRADNSCFQAGILHMLDYLPFPEVAERESPPLSPGQTYLFCRFVFLSSPSFNLSFSSHMRKVETAILTLLESHLDQEFRYCLFHDETGTPQVIVAISDEQAPSLLAQCSHLLASQGIPGSVHVAMLHAKTRALSTLLTMDDKQNIALILRNGEIRDIASFDSADLAFLDVMQAIIDAYGQQDGEAYAQALATLSDSYGVCPDAIPFPPLLSSLKLCIPELEEASPASYGTVLSVLRELPVGRKSYGTDTIEQIQEYLRDHYMDNLGIASIAERFSLTPNYLSSLFHKKTGTKLLDFLTEIRLEQARHLLLSNETTSVKDIAVLVGYTNPKYFSTVFKHTYGMLPTQFRKNGSIATPRKTRV